MPISVNNRSNNILGIIVIVAVLITLSAVGLKLFLTRQHPTPEVDKTQTVVHNPVVEQPVINYNDLDKDPSLQNLMQERKSRYGVQNGVDMIVQADETFKIGETVVPMSEILEKIKIKRGGIVEKDLNETYQSQQMENNHKNMEKRYAELENQLAELETRLNDPEIKKNDQKYKALLEKYAQMSKAVLNYQEYKELESEYQQSLDQLNNADSSQKQELKDKIKILTLRKNDLENELVKYLQFQGNKDVYGIYVVKPSDNIWNIHFKFLKEYFENKGISLSPLADEKGPDGFSSGVGKILKFSENMVYIYNIREKQLEVNLDLIHPLSKIVVFNMGQVFSLLNDIDYAHINHVNFDGDTLWIPAEQ